MTPTAAPTELRLQLFPKQAEFVMATDQFTAMTGGVGSGKTQAFAVKALRYAVDHPGSLGMVTAPTFPMLRDATLRKIRELWPPGVATFHEAEMRLSLANGSEVLLRSTDDPDRLRGPTLAWFGMDEPGRWANDYPAFLVLQGRLRQAGYPPQGWLTTTPNGFNWVYSEFGSRQRPGYRLIQVSTRENPFVTPEYIRTLEESYGPELSLQEIEGQFVVVGGQAVFDLAALNAMQADVREPVEQIGPANVYQRFAMGKKYAVFTDTSHGVRGDDAVTVVKDLTTGYIAADIQSNVISPEELALGSLKLLEVYQRPLWAIEDNDWGVLTLRKAQDAGYPNLFRDPDRPGSVGWHTSERNRYILWGELVEAVKARLITVPSKAGLAQFYSVVRNPAKGGRIEAASGAHDDYPFAVGGAWQLRKVAHRSITPEQRERAQVGWRQRW